MLDFFMLIILIFCELAILIGLLFLICVTLYKIDHLITKILVGSILGILYAILIAVQVNVDIFIINQIKN